MFKSKVITILSLTIILGGLLFISPAFAETNQPRLNPNFLASLFQALNDLSEVLRDTADALKTISTGETIPTPVAPIQSVSPLPQTQSSTPTREPTQQSLSGIQETVNQIKTTISALQTTVGQQASTRNVQPVLRPQPPQNLTNPLTPSEFKPMEPEFVKGSLLVKFKPGFTPNSVLNKVPQEFRFTQSKKLFLARHQTNSLLRDTYELRISETIDPRLVASEYQKLTAEVVYAEPNFIARTQQAPAQEAQMARVPQIPPNDPFYSQQWHLTKVSAEAAWSIETGNPNTVIAVIDTGVRWNHPDLAANIWINTGEIPNNNIDDDNNGYIDDVRGWDFVEITPGSFYTCWPGEDCSTEDNNPDDFYGHGTHVGGIATAATNNGIGVSGICWFCKIMPVRAGFAANIGGSYPAGLLEYDDIAEALAYAADNRADVISMSFGGWGSFVMQNAINYAYSQGKFLVAAAGNLNTDDTSSAYPAAYSNVIAVSATDQTDQKAGFSNYGYWVDIAAPGVSILSSVIPGVAWACTDASYPPNSDGFGLCHGTSMATPLVSGIIGLALSKIPTLTQDQILTLVHSAKDPLNLLFYIGTGRVNALKAVQPSSVGLALLDSGLDNAFYGPQTVTISGTAGGQNFQNYQVRFGTGIYPISWTTIQSSSLPVANSLLASWNIAAGTLSAGIYTIKLAVTSTQGIWEDEAIVAVDPTLVSGWPKQINDKNGTSPALTDVDGDGDGEIFFQAKGLNATGWFYDTFHAIDHNGLPFPGWPLGSSVNIGAGFNPFSPPVANIDTDIEFEIVNNSAGWGTNQYFVHQAGGTIQPGWPATTGTGYINVNGQIAAIADITGSVGKEIVVFVMTNNASNFCDLENKIYVYQQNGQIAPGWPKTVQCLPRGIAVGDIDNNGDQEIVLTTRTSLTGGIPNAYVFNHDGTNFSGWPKINFESWSAPVLADLDQNDGGKLEIILAQFTGPPAQLYAFNHNGTVVPGWPQPYVSTIYAPAVGDIDSNGDLEIVFTSDYVYGVGHLVYVLNHNGTIFPGWPVYVTGYLSGVGGGHDPFTSPVIADLDGNGLMEILVVTLGILQSPGKLFGFNGNGTPIPNFPKPLASLASAPVVGKIDGDNLLDAFVIDNTGKMYLWEFTGTATSSALQWPMFHHDPQHTGKYP